MIESINPATGAVSATLALHAAAAVDAALSDAVSAQRDWAQQSVEQRCALLHRLAAVLRKNKPAYARLITTEMGKPITEAESEIEKSAVTCEFYADHAVEFLADQPVASNAARSAVVFDPLGVVLAIMPWNYPFWQFIRFAAPALAAGNGAILKHANNVPDCALALEAAFIEAGFPEGLVGTVLIDAADVAAIIADPRIAALTLTGSTAVGKLVASQAGSVLKKQVLELGGSDPFIVLRDADIDAAARTAVKARFSNTGQSCISAKRFIVDETVADAFSAAFCEHASRLKVGDPLARGTDIGPMARANLRDALHHQVQRSVAAGATLRLGGHALALEGFEHGFYYAPTILDHVTEDMAAAIEETFGPAAAILRVPNEAEAIRLANATEFGLGAALWTGDVEHGARLARRIDAGAVFINGMVASDARLPFGGIKQSGYGRELGDYGIREFTNIKSVWIGPAR
jgi:succinate-semialdehyde dehydrogenase/glutarate-semialdehyde dehydrogenase